MLEIPLPSIETKEGWFSVRVRKTDNFDTGRMDWAPVGRHREWAPCPVLWRLQRTFRGDDTDALGGVGLTIQHITNWSQMCRVFPRFREGYLYTFEPPFWWVAPSRSAWELVDNRPSPIADLHHAMMVMLPIHQVLTEAVAAWGVHAPQTRGLNLDIKHLLLWAREHNGNLAVHLDQWLEQSSFQLSGLSGEAPTPEVLLAEFRAYVRSAPMQDGSYVPAFIAAKGYSRETAALLQQILARGLPTAR